MTQAYGSAFARVYNQLWSGFALNAAPKIRSFFETSQISKSDKSLLDLCCGSGVLTRHFLDHGYRVTALDLSAEMLEHARLNNLPYITAGLVDFIQADASAFVLEQRYSLVVSTFDALNHLPDFGALVNCFLCTHAVLVDDGVFIFDLNTRLGLETRWTGMSTEDRPDLFLLNRAVWVEEEQRAYTRITGFLRADNGFFERFVETVYNCAFELDAVLRALEECSFKNVYMARLDNLQEPLENPEAEGRVFFIAKK